MVMITLLDRYYNEQLPYKLSSPSHIRISFSLAFPTPLALAASRFMENTLFGTRNLRNGSLK
jgi:hypothetical protein